MSWVSSWNVTRHKKWTGRLTAHATLSTRGLLFGSRDPRLLTLTVWNAPYPRECTSCLSDSRSFSTQASETKPEAQTLAKFRNFGISAHIDSGKTTLTERILFYTGRIKEINDVRGKSGKGAVMDFMPLEREKGITITSAATFCKWGDLDYNIIDTPGHVDFTVEVERALKVLDGAVMVCCGVGGVQAQTKTVHRQMCRYEVPRVVFVNKMDRFGADPQYVIRQIRERLGLTVAAVQVPIGAEDKFLGVYDVIRQRAVYFEGDQGIQRRYAELPENLVDEATRVREELIETLADLDDDIAEAYLEEGGAAAIAPHQIHAAIRRQVIARTFCPVLMGSAYKNKGVQELLDGIELYLPSPLDRVNKGFDTANDDEEVTLESDPKKNLVAYGFKIQDHPNLGTITFARIYQGTLRQGDSLYDLRKNKRVKPVRLVRMHSNQTQEIEQAGPGEIVAMSGMDVVSGTTFTDGKTKIACSSMYVPDPVMSLAVDVKDPNESTRFGKAIARFRREDPTFHLETNPETKQMIMRGMGELHLEIYLERMKREFNVNSCETGEPLVNYKETIQERANFDFTYKRQSGGRGQYAKVIGYFEPISEEDEIVEASEETSKKSTIEFRSDLTGNDIPPNYVPSIEKGWREAASKGFLSGHELVNVRFVVEDGRAHENDSSDLAFRLAAQGAVKEFLQDCAPLILEPRMKLDVVIPTENQAAVLQNLNTREGTVTNTSAIGSDATLVEAIVPLRSMFGYSKDLRSMTTGQGEFNMEFLEYIPMPANEQQILCEKYARANMSDQELMREKAEENKKAKKAKYAA